jgi:serine/threonine-protein kinase RsbW
VPTAEGTEVPRDGFGWAILVTLVDAVDARRSTQAAVPAGDGTDNPVGLITMDKYLPGQRPPEVGSGAGQNLSVAR